MTDKVILSIRALRNNPDFHEVMKHVLGATWMFTSVFDRDTIVMAGRAAQQEIGSELLDLIAEADKDLFYKLLANRNEETSINSDEEPETYSGS